MDDRIPAAVALVVALLLVASPTILFPHVGETPYCHSLERIDRSNVPADADVLAYDDLSAEARQAVDSAR